MRWHVRLVRYCCSAEIRASYLTRSYTSHAKTGKTSLVRDLTRLLAETSNVCIVDTSNEIAGECDTKHYSIGSARRMMVPRPDVQAAVMVECVQVSAYSVLWCACMQLAVVRYVAAHSKPNAQRS
jgi:stage III sporulation protein SpoIIIAA